MPKELFHLKYEQQIKENKLPSLLRRGLNGIGVTNRFEYFLELYIRIFR